MRELSAKEMNRREALGAGSLALTLAPTRHDAPDLANRTSINLTCLIRYQIDPFQFEAFRKYAENWGRIIPRCGGHLIGYFLPREGTNDIGWGLISFDSLTSYERYRMRLKSDPEARKNFEDAQTMRFILREERTFVEGVAGTLEVPSTLNAD